MLIPTFAHNEWENVDENYRLNKSQNTKSPDDFQKEVEELNKKFNNPETGNVFDEKKL